MPQTPQRILIAGGPRTGKTTLARYIASATGFLLLHTDSLISTHEWSEASAEVAKWMQQPGPWIIEGVAIPRAVRKWLDVNEGHPADLIYFLSVPVVELSGKQAAMAAGCKTVWDEISPVLAERKLSIAPIGADGVDIDPNELPTDCE